MKVLVYKNKLGREHFLTELDATNWKFIPQKGDIISFGDEADMSDETYEVIQRQLDVAKRSVEGAGNEIALFVRVYNGWDD